MTKKLTRKEKSKINKANFAASRSRSSSAKAWVPVRYRGKSAPARTKAPSSPHTAGPGYTEADKQFVRKYGGDYYAMNSEETADQLPRSVVNRLDKIMDKMGSDQFYTVARGG